MTQTQSLKQKFSSFVKKVAHLIVFFFVWVEPRHFRIHVRQKQCSQAAACIQNVIKCTQKWHRCGFHLRKIANLLSLIANFSVTISIQIAHCLPSLLKHVYIHFHAAWQLWVLRDDLYQTNITGKGRQTMNLRTSTHPCTWNALSISLSCFSRHSLRWAGVGKKLAW